MIRALVAACLIASPIFAGEAALGDLGRKIESLGQHETDEVRHALALDGCDMTITVWKEWDDKGKVLLSVHHFELEGYLPLDARPKKHKTGWFALGSGDSFSEVLMIQMRSHDYLTSELSMRSKPSPPYEASDRKDLDTFVKKRRLFHGLRFDDLSEGRMETMAGLLDRYYYENCAGAS